jgi:hypothetical protein
MIFFLFCYPVMKTKKLEGERERETTRTTPTEGVSELTARTEVERRWRNKVPDSDEYGERGDGEQGDLGGEPDPLGKAQVGHRAQHAGASRTRAPCRQREPGCVTTPPTSESHTHYRAHHTHTPTHGRRTVLGVEGGESEECDFAETGTEGGQHHAQQAHPGTISATTTRI